MSIPTVAKFGILASPSNLALRILLRAFAAAHDAVASCNHGSSLD
jgi:hypothetical protein